MNNRVLFDDGKVKWIVFGRDSSKPDVVIDTNEYAIVCDGEAILLDPGGTEIFPYVLSAVSEALDLRQCSGCRHGYQARFNNSADRSRSLLALLR